MSSTSNKNTRNNYCLEQKQNNRQFDYVHMYGKQHKTNMPCVGLNPGKMPRDKLSINSVDTESYLFGIGSTNLANPTPRERPQPLYPSAINRDNIFDKQKEVIYPDPFTVDFTQRPWQSDNSWRTTSANLYSRN